MIRFKIIHQDPASAARVGIIKLKNYSVDTPNFMPVATQATVKMIDPASLKKIGVQIIVCNTYHLMLRPTSPLIKQFGGLHRFMSWDRAILTDSGGFQAYSLNTLRKVNDDGIEFSSHLDGSRHFLSPELAVSIQKELGSDIAMCLDFFTGYPSSVLDARLAVERTLQWAKRSIKGSTKNIFGIIQGATYKDLRRECARRLVDLDFPGYGIGGLMIGEPSSLTQEMVFEVNQEIPVKKIRYLMGAGYPEDIVEAVSRGVDLFDCVLPTRNGRTGMAFTTGGKIIVKASRYAQDTAPIDPECTCFTCRNFSRGYIRHLFNAGEALAGRLVSYHNLHFYIKLMGQLRSSIKSGKLAGFTQKCRSSFNFRE
ncbi:tRNA guanosine(34) transglycosylase Tgt [candidate division WOR-3 bacterium RBG_13_43_14]|uniref:Queuine tRNA-ribosyltransferase n=1 Tax=candidate division WOR-3 bacterium RBG_13_43_14 TaxID=1802590 RepID=A0A1F4UB41_UNCW3|nr:MAG: tRNA guanosine(34) transglycosylase Tgt [candidate division WOR-3 bacterium RBG_13_43_14]